MTILKVVTKQRQLKLAQTDFEGKKKQINNHNNLNLTLSNIKRTP